MIERSGPFDDGRLREAEESTKNNYVRYQSAQDNLRVDDPDHRSLTEMFDDTQQIFASEAWLFGLSAQEADRLKFNVLLAISKAGRP